MLLYNHPLCFFFLCVCVCFFNLLTLRLSIAQSKISLGKCHIALENMSVIFKYLLILISNINPQCQENKLCMISIPLDHEMFTPCFMSLDVPVSSSLQSLGT